MRSSFLSAFALLLFVALRAFGAGNDSRVGAWPEQTSEIRQDPKLATGVLSNGLRFMIYPNNEPKGRISLRFVVAVGSLHERDDELGLAHFVEHMVFRGTQQYPGDQLTAELQRMGVGFGADNTAFTHYEHTDYHLDLPNPRPETLRRGLEIFRQYSESVLFDPAALEIERGVVLSEKATRDDEGYRVFIANQRFLWPTSRYTARPVIGSVTTLKSCTRDQLVAFYDAWYRPERMAVIIVGDVDPQQTAQLIIDVFGSLKARAPPREIPNVFVPESPAAPNIDVARDPTFRGVTLTFEHPRRIPTRSLTREERADGMRRSLAFAMFQRRLERIARESGDALVSASAYLSSPGPGWEVAAFSASSRVTAWKDLARKIEQEHRRAFRYGFTAAEFEPVRKSFLEAYDLGVTMASSRKSDQIAGELIGILLSPEPFQSLEDRRDEARAAIEATTLRDCRDAFRAAWDKTALHVFATINSDFRINELDVAQLLNESRATDVKPADEEKAIEFAYTDFGPAGSLVKDERVTDLDVRLAQFGNGVRVNFKQTNFESDLVRFQVRVGHGLLSLPQDKPGLAWLAGSSFIAGGLWKHTALEIGDLLAGRSVHFAFYIDGDAYSFYGYCRRRDLLLTLQLVAAYCQDARFDSTAARQAISSYNGTWSHCEESPGGPIQIVAERVMTDDKRFGIPWQKEFAERTMAEVALCLEPELKRGPIDMSLVGDVTWDEAAQAVARTLGALPQRQARVEPPVRDLPRIKGERKKPYIYLTPARLSQAALAWHFPVPEVEDIHQERRCILLGEVLAERIRVRLREELGAAYAPTASFVRHEGFPAFNYFMIYAEVEATKAQQAAAIVNREIDALRTQGLTEDEFIRAKRPYLKAREDDVRTNDYWCFTVLRDAQRRPEHLAAARDRAQDGAAITREDLQKLIKRYLNRGKAYFFVAEPGKAHSWK